ncbi:MAG: hypothetical protein AAFV88_03950 [Planctomycetota bacterium]
MSTQGDYTLVGEDLTGFWLQPGFVEGIVADRQQFSSLPKAFRHIFRRNLEFAVVLWNGIPVRFSYQQDLAEMTVGLIDMIGFVQSGEEGARRSFEFETPNLRVCWRVELEPEWLVLEADWKCVPGGYEAALNQLGMIRMRRDAFLCEWKLLLEQFAQALDDSEATLTSDLARSQAEQIRQLSVSVPKRGRFYRCPDAVLTTNRRQPDTSPGN